MINCFVRGKNGANFVLKYEFPRDENRVRRQELQNSLEATFIPLLRYGIDFTVASVLHT